MMKAQILFSPAFGWSVMIYASEIAANDPDYSLPLIQLPCKHEYHAQRIADAINDNPATAQRGKLDE